MEGTMKTVAVLALFLSSPVVLPPTLGDVGSGSSALRRDEDSSEARAVIDRFLESGSPELRSYVARRQMTASTRGGRMHAYLEARTSLDAAGTFRFEVVCAEGSGLIQRRVLTAALEAERLSRLPDEAAHAALTRDNYDFALVVPLEGGLREIRLLPRRRSQLLITGRALVRDVSADLTLVEGRVSKTPSWWTRRVDIVRRYDRIAGVRVPVEMTSTADVRIVGDSSFMMTYDYEAINGRALDRPSSPSRCQRALGSGERPET
jgi:hypothetical protein